MIKSVKIIPFGGTMKNNIFFPADILLPDCQKVDYEKFSVIACDQYTSEPEYWENAENFSLYSTCCKLS